MKNILILCLLALLIIACKEDKEPFQQSTLQFTTYLEKPLNTVWVNFMLFDANNIEYADQQDPSSLKKLLALDKEGKTHYVYKTLSSSNGTAHLYIKDGKYFMVLMIKETGKYSHTYIEIKNGELVKVMKVFTSSLPENTFENW